MTLTREEFKVAHNNIGKDGYKEKEEVFVNLFSQCRDYGFTESQILYILSLIKASQNEI